MSFRSLLIRMGTDFHAARAVCLAIFVQYVVCISFQTFIEVDMKYFLQEM